MQRTRYGKQYKYNVRKSTTNSLETFQLYSLPASYNDNVESFIVTFELRIDSVSNVKK